MNSNFSIPRRAAWAAWVVASLFYAYQYILRVMPNIMAVDIMQRFHIDAAAFGQFSGIYYIGYSLMHLPIGIMLDRVGPRAIMAISIVMTVAGLIPLLLAEHWLYPIIGRCLTGMGSTGAILSVFKIIRMAFAESRFPRMLGFSVTIGLVGAIYGGGPVSYMYDLFGYQYVIASFMVMGAILACTAYIVIPRIEEESASTVMADIREVITNKKIILISVCAGMMVGPMEGFADVWAALFLKQVYDINGSQAATMPSLIFIGMCIGSPILNMIGDKTRSYLKTITGSGIVMAALFSWLLFIQSHVTWLMIAFFTIGICSAYQVLAIYVASTYARKEVQGLTTAVANMIIMAFGYAFHSVIGAVVEISGGTSSSYALISGVSVIPIALLIGTVGFAFLQNERKRESQVYERDV